MLDFDASDFCELQVSEERCEAAISSIVNDNDISIFQSDAIIGDCANHQDGEMYFNHNNDFMQAGIADLKACFNDEIFFRVVNERGEQSK